MEDRVTETVHTEFELGLELDSAGEWTDSRGEKGVATRSLETPTAKGMKAVDEAMESVVATRLVLRAVYFLSLTTLQRSVGLCCSTGWKLDASYSTSYHSGSGSDGGMASKGRGD